MNFPENPLFEFLFWLINTPGIGGITVGLLALGIVTAVSTTLRWIMLGGQIDERVVYAYPTPALHEHGE